MAFNSMLGRRSVSIVACPVAIWRGERSTPRKRLSGRSCAMGRRLAPVPQPSSSTRHRSTAGVRTPAAPPPPPDGPGECSRTRCCRTGLRRNWSVVHRTWQFLFKHRPAAPPGRRMQPEPGGMVAGVSSRSLSQSSSRTIRAAIPDPAAGGGYSWHLLLGHWYHCLCSSILLRNFFFAVQ